MTDDCDDDIALAAVVSLVAPLLHSAAAARTNRSGENLVGLFNALE
ncbi:MAG TPA: hypothetical protein VGO73_05665 [Pyrinomonadaceae bacterium]|jgi:hypothetical protein|nr:hypothetical protein [Pyrinomonadaceae bacterium]